jgi:flagellar basal body-associated protein FliL
LSAHQEDGQNPNKDSHASEAKGHETAESGESIDMNPPELSADEMDSFLKENDPEFMNSVQKIGTDKSLSLAEEEVDEAREALLAEIELWKSYKGIWKIVYKVIPFSPYLSFRSKNIRFKLKSFFYGIFIRIKNFAFYLLKEGLPKTFKKIKNFFGRISESVGKAAHVFKYLKWQIKLIFFVAVAFVGTASFVAFKSFKKDFIKEDKRLFIASLGELSSHEYPYNPSETEPYINNARAAQNVILTRKTFVNLKPSPNSGPNPMAAFEFFIEGMTSDVVVEIKDREPKVHDLIQRTIEEMSFDQLDSEDGKKELCQKIQDAVTKILSTGSVKAVRIKTIILKP